MTKSEDQIKLFDFKFGKLQELYSEAYNGNYIVIGQTLFFLRLQASNAIELVLYDINGQKEIERISNANSAKVTQVCLVKDYENQLDIYTPEDMKAKAILGVFKPDENNTWEFRKASDYSKLLFKIEQASSESVWCLYNGLNEKVLLWNQLMDRNKVYFEVGVYSGDIELGTKHTLLNDQFQHLLNTKSHKLDRDKFKVLDQVKTRSYYCKDKERLDKFVGDVFNE